MDLGAFVISCGSADLGFLEWWMDRMAGTDRTVAAGVAAVRAG